jgi:hypothetical protein
MIVRAGRSPLDEVPLASVWPPIAGECYATMSPDQWDDMLAAVYASGWILVEVNDDEKPVRAFRRK